MSGIRGVMKDGWHPKGRDGKKESWRSDFKGINQVAGWMGKGKDKDSDQESHVSRPISSLKDPASFGPPPRHVKVHGAAALPNQTTPDRSGIGAPLSQEQIDHHHQQQQEEEERLAREEEEEAQRPAGPPVPFRANRTGFDPSYLPPPPVRRTGSPADFSAASTTSSRPKPSVPPRVPPRANSTPSPQPPPPAPPRAYYPGQATPEEAGDGYVNAAAVSRLSQAGVSVPALGIGSDSGQWSRDSTQAPPAVPSSGTNNQAPVNELQTRFSQMRTTPTPPPPARQGSNLSSYSTKEQPSSSGSFGGARTALNNFREQHSDKIEAGKQKLSGFNQKYGLTQRANAALGRSSPSTTTTTPPNPRSPANSENQAPPLPPHPNLSRTNSGVEGEEAAPTRKKAPPPPPPKKAGMRSTPVGVSAVAPSSTPSPPPLPLNTKPR